METIIQSLTARTTVKREGDSVIVTETTDVTRNLDRVKRMREAEINSETLGHCIAAIPLAAIVEWGAPLGLTCAQVVADDKLLDRCIADYSRFKVRGGIH